MKFLFFLFCISISSVGNAQDSPYKHLKIENRSAIFEKVYVVEDSTINVERALTLNVPKIKGFSDYNKTNEIITGKINAVDVDYRKYGGKWANTWTYIIHPMYADVVIVWKEGKYRVTVSNIRFVASTSLILNFSDGVTKKKGTLFNTNDIIVRSARYVENTLDEMFEIKLSGDNW